MSLQQDRDTSAHAGRRQAALSSTGIDTTGKQMSFTAGLFCAVAVQHPGTVSANLVRATRDGCEPFHKVEGHFGTSSATGRGAHQMNLSLSISKPLASQYLV